MGFYKNDSDSRKTVLFPSNGDKNADRIYATEKGLVTKAGGCGNPDADPEVLVCQGGLDDSWGTAHLVGFEWKRNIRSKNKGSWNSEATILPENYTMEQYLARVRTNEYSWSTGDWRGWLVACTAHFSEPVWVTGTNNISPRLKITLGEPGESAVTKYLTYKNTDLYANDYINDVAEYNATIMNTGYDDYISSINITNGGSGYVVPPQISFGQDDSGQLPSILPQAYAVIKDGAVTDIVIYNGGSGYNYQLVPTVVFDNTGTGPSGGPDGGGAAATAIRINRGDGTKGMTNKQYRNQYLYPNGSSSITFAAETPIEVLGFPNFMWAPGTTFAIPENAIDLNGGTITEGTSAGGANAVITSSASRGSSAGGVTVFHQTGEGWIYI